MGTQRPCVIATTLLFSVFSACCSRRVAEVLFWNEFGARFNFIAVDYLIYTRETFGNIRQSFPVMPLLYRPAGGDCGAVLVDQTQGLGGRRRRRRKRVESPLSYEYASIVAHRLIFAGG